MNTLPRRFPLCLKKFKQKCNYWKQQLSFWPGDQRRNDQLSFLIFSDIRAKLLTSNVQRSSVQLYSQTGPAIPVYRAKLHITSDNFLFEILSLHGFVICVALNDLENKSRNWFVLRNAIARKLRQVNAVLTQWAISLTKEQLCNSRFKQCPPPERYLPTV